MTGGIVKSVMLNSVHQLVGHHQDSMLVLVVASLRWRLSDPLGIALQSRTLRHMSPPSLMMGGIVVQHALDRTSVVIWNVIDWRESVTAAVIDSSGLQHRQVCCC